MDIDQGAVVGAVVVAGAGVVAVVVRFVVAVVGVDGFARADSARPGEDVVITHESDQEPQPRTPGTLDVAIARLVWMYPEWAEFARRDLPALIEAAAAEIESLRAAKEKV